MRIAQVRQKFPVDGGVEFHVYNLSKRLVGRGHQVTVFTSDRDLGWSRAFKPGLAYLDGIQMRRLSAPIKLFRVLIMPGLVTALLRAKADLIHAHGFFYFSTDAAALASLLSGKPLVYTPHFQPYSIYSDRLERWLRFGYEKTLAGLALRVAKRIIAVSPSSRDYLVRKLGVDEGKVTVIPPSGVDIQAFAQGQGLHFRERYGINSQKMALYVGRLSERKGLAYLVEAMPQVLREVPGLKLVLIGPDGGARQPLERLAARLGVSEALTFVGYLDYSYLAEAYAAADIFVLPSLYEAFGIVLIEAMASSTPLVATRTGSISHIVEEGRTGLLVEPRNPDQLAQAMVRLLLDSRLAAELAERGRLQVTKNYDWEAITDQVIEVYEQALRE